MPKSIKAAQAAAAKKIPKPYTGTVPDPRNTAAGDAAAASRASQQRDRAEVDHALGTGAYDRIKRS